MVIPENNRVTAFSAVVRPQLQNPVEMTALPSALPYYSPGKFGFESVHDFTFFI